MLSQLKSYKKQYSFVIVIGIITGCAVIFFETINLLVIYRQIKMDYYISFVAILFFMGGLFINKKRSESKTVKEPGFTILTAREIQILQLIADGKTNKEIAGVHFIEVSTVKTHINNIYTKLSLRNRKDATAKYHEIYCKSTFN